MRWQRSWRPTWICGLPSQRSGAIAYRGHEGIRQWLADVDESFSRAHIEPLEFEDFGRLVLALTSIEVEGGESRLEIDSELGLLCRIGDGRIVSWKGHFSHAAARAEAEGRDSI